MMQSMVGSLTLMAHLQLKKRLLKNVTCARGVGSAEFVHDLWFVFSCRDFYCTIFQQSDCSRCYKFTWSLFTITTKLKSKSSRYLWCLLSNKSCPLLLSADWSSISSKLSFSSSYTAGSPFSPMRGSTLSSSSPTFDLSSLSFLHMRHSKNHLMVCQSLRAKESSAAQSAIHADMAPTTVPVKTNYFNKWSKVLRNGSPE